MPKRKRPPAADRPLKKPYSVNLVTVSAMLLPGSGQMLNGDPVRGITMQFFMMLMAFITYQVTGPEISFVGRIAGGVLVYLVSVLDARGVAVRRMRAWERMTNPQPATPVPAESKAAESKAAESKAAGPDPESAEPNPAETETASPVSSGSGSGQVGATP